jgi:16S rRNA (guanine527-N7)-methyltransferase
MKPARIAELLAPFLTAGASPAQLSGIQLDQISIYIDLLLRWNARINLTAIRTPEEIVTRHFGESLFAARHLLPCGADSGSPARPVSACWGEGTPVRVAAEPGKEVSVTCDPVPARSMVDLGSGAGFPGLPLKIWSPQSPVTLLESSHKKVAFLREVIRLLTLTSINVFAGRAGTYPAASAPLVTLRAVERFESILPVAAALVAPEGRLALLIATPQISAAQANPLAWAAPIPIPQSASRVLVVGKQLGPK